MQIVLNVLLFVPLGYFLRVILHRGVVVATVAGFGLSLLIELTQKTGVWHLYSCAYRLFDVDDLIVNTLGATVGSLLSILVVRRRAGKVVLPTTISFGRRLVGFACDVLFIALTGAAAALAYRGIEIYLRDVPPLDVSRTRAGRPAVGRPVRGRGGAGARLRSHRGRVGGLAAHRPETAPAAACRAASSSWPSGWVRSSCWRRSTTRSSRRSPIPLLAAYAVLTVAFAWRTKNHRGLSHTLAHLDLRIGDDADEDPEDAELWCSKTARHEMMRPVVTDEQ